MLLYYSCLEGGGGGEAASNAWKERRGHIGWPHHINSRADPIRFCWGCSLGTIWKSKAKMCTVSQWEHHNTQPVENETAFGKDKLRNLS